MGACVVLASEYGLILDPTTTFATAYTLLVTLFAARALPPLGVVERIYGLKHFDTVSLLLYLPTILLVFFVGYSLGNAVVFARTVVALVESAMVGVAASTALFLTLEVAAPLLLRR